MFFRPKLFALLALGALVACADNAPRPVAPAPAPKPPVATPAPDAGADSDAEEDPLDNPKASPEAVQAALAELRRSKDVAFKRAQNSPIPAAERDAFTGLKYYPVDLAYRFVSQLKPCTVSTPIKMAATKGEERTYRCFGMLEFTLDGKTHALMALKNAAPTAPGESKILFVPFRDATSGKETYGAGRYLEIEENRSGVYVLDFNRAFSPFCAYNDDFSCPFPPPQNVLTVAIRAGEKSFHEAKR
jgi:hypothetical protein